MGEIHEYKDEFAIALPSNEVEERYEGGRCRKETFFDVASSLVIRHLSIAFSRDMLLTY